MILLIIGLLIELIFRSKKQKPYLYCGLVGFSAIDYYFSKDKIANLLYWNQERGKDATGIYTPETGLKKSLKKAEDYLSDDYWNEVIEDNIFIGHVRAATYGVNNLKNCHPFQYGNIVLAHNGTLDYPWVLCNKLGLNSADYDVDSQVLAASLNKEQNLECLRRFEGAAAIIFTNTDTPELLYVYRNKERPLFRGVGEEGMYISSIEKSLKAIGCKDIKEFKEDYFYTIKDGKVKSQMKIIKNPFPSPIQNTYYSHNSRLNRHYEELEKWGLAGEAPIAQQHHTPQVIEKPNYRGKEILNTWLRADLHTNTALEKPIALTRNNWYFCSGIAKMRADRFIEHIYITDDNNNKVVVPTMYFKYEEIYDLNLVNYVYITNDLYDDPKKEETLCAKEGEIWKITTHWPNKQRTVFNEYTGREATFWDKNIRPATLEEMAKYKEKLKNKGKKINVEKLKEIEETSAEFIDSILAGIEDKKVRGTELYTLTSNQITELMEKLRFFKDTLKGEINEVLNEQVSEETPSTL